MTNWIDLRTSSTGKELRRILEPMPKGPYLVVSQFDDNIRGLSQKETIGLNIGRWVEAIPSYYWGEVIYSFETGYAILCATWYDTSG